MKKKTKRFFQSIKQNERINKSNNLLPKSAFALNDKQLSISDLPLVTNRQTVKSNIKDYFIPESLMQYKDGTFRVICSFRGHRVELSTEVFKQLMDKNKVLLTDTEKETIIKALFEKQEN